MKGKHHSHQQRDKRRVVHAPNPISPLKQLDYSLENQNCGLTHLPGVYLFKSTFFQCACVHKKRGLTHSPSSWLTTSGQSSVGRKIVRNRGATPKCHHSCKTAEHKSQITEICIPKLPDKENRGTFEWSTAHI